MKETSNAKCPNPDCESDLSLPFDAQVEERGICVVCLSEYEVARVNPIILRTIFDDGSAND